MPFASSVLLALGLGFSPQGGAPESAASFAEAARVVSEAVESGLVPGAVLIVGRGDDVLFQEAVGLRAPGEAMTLDTVFDMASVTKSFATAASIAHLMQEGKLRPEQRVDELLPDFVPKDFGVADSPITVEHLLLHTSGLAPANPLSDFTGADPFASALRAFSRRPLRHSPGAEFLYSDLGFMTLGAIVERVSGRSLAEYAIAEVFRPLGLMDTSFGPIKDERLQRTAPTEPGTPRGVVHDPRARAVGGVAGHAGLFSTAGDLGRFCAFLATSLQPEAPSAAGAPLSVESVRGMTATRMVPSPVRDVEKAVAAKSRAGHGTARAYGLDVATRFSSPRGARFPRFQSFGHTGFTGPCFWIDAKTGVWYALLASRLQVEGQSPSLTALRRRVADAVADGASVGEHRFAPGVLTGIDVLEAEDCARLEGLRLGLITNVTGRTVAGRRTIDVLHESQLANLVKLFSPEHGLFAKLEGSVGDATDVASGLPVYSLYGATRKPTPEMLEGLDVLLFDIQDIGVRYYTYISTLGLAMEACAEAGVRVMVLDRPNPITGERVAGPLTDEDRLSFIGWRPLPLTHGMTIGELAKMFNVEWGGIGCSLEVVEMSGWSRSMWWEETGVPWVNPSPNMRNPTQATLYPCIGLLEGANLSVGRGTDEPFERFGAPWIDGKALADALRRDDLPGIQFAPLSFTPDASKFAGELCRGVQVTVVDRDRFEPVAAGMAILWHLNDLFGDRFNAARGDSRLLSADTFDALMGAVDWRAVPSTWARDVAEFQSLRAPYLLYR